MPPGIEGLEIMPLVSSDHSIIFLGPLEEDSSVIEFDRTLEWSTDKECPLIEEGKILLCTEAFINWKKWCCF